MLTHWQNPCAVFIGGALGGVCRWGVDLGLHDAQSMLGTTAVNLIGCFLLTALTYGLAQRLSLPNWLILFLGTGFVGAFTTFSTFVLNLMQHLNGYGLMIFALNLLGGVLMTVLAFWLATRNQRRPA